MIFRGPYLPWAGQVDFTLEALVYGGVLGLRILAIFGTAVFLNAAVDNDELLRALRRVSLRSGVTAALAMRLLGVLRRDAARLADASAACPAAAPRGCRCCTRSPRARWTARPTWRRRSRCAASARRASAPDAAPVVAARLRVLRERDRPVRDRGRRCRRPVAQFDAYPRLEASLEPATLAVTVALVVCAVLPFADRRGIVR